MAQTFQTSGVVTDAGIAASILAGTTGPVMSVGGFRIGAPSAAQGAVAQTTDVDVDGFVYAGDTGAMTYGASPSDPDVVVWRIRLDSNVGSFPMGNFGIVLTDGTLLCKGVLPGQIPKWIDNLPTTQGNVQYLNMIMRLANAADLLNLTLLVAEESSLPEVSTEANLPDANATVFDAYLVDNHTHAGVPTTSVRRVGNWWHAPHRLDPGQGDGVAVLTAGAFATGTGLLSDGARPAPALGPVAWDATLNKFVAADGVVDSLGPVGLRTSTFEITTLGIIRGSRAGLTGGLAFGTVYYAGTGAAAGTLVTTPTGVPVAVATSATDLYVDASGSLLRFFSGDRSNPEEVSADLLGATARAASAQILLEDRVRRLAEADFQTSTTLGNSTLWL